VLRGSVRVKGRLLQKSLDRVSKASELADIVGEARVEATWTGKAVVAARTYATGFVLGTCLYGVYEETERRSGSHIVGGAAGGLVHGSLSHLLSAETLPRFTLRGLPSAASRDSVSHAILFSSYAFLKRQLAGSEQRPIEAETGGDEAVSARPVLAVLGAGSLAGAAQSLTASAVSREPIQWRSVVRTAPASGVAFAAYELGLALARGQGQADGASE
jgi:hypothetical protein